MSEVKEIDWYTLAGAGIIGGLICIYAAVILDAALGVNYFIFLGAIGAILATLWGADAVRKICKYGIGTGVPSIGMLAFGMGLLATLLGLKFGDYLVAKNILAMEVVGGIKAGLLVGPLAALVMALVQGFVIGFIAQNILKMKIPTMQVGMTMISGAASLIYLGYTVTIAGAFDFGTLVNNVINTGFIAPLFIVGALPMLHPFNACLGPDENQRRTLTLGVEAALMSTVIFGILSFAIFPNDIIGPVITVLLGLVAWVFAYLAYWQKVKESGTIILPTGLLPKKEEGQ
ncbi:MAG: Tetrahydromethanopterin S-methyltransferase subunit C [Methanocella sp. PtaU1.Bin125]|nr:MAG: Tetrahydromethanopterin S-methyltransferase subunit C [Methanocella sp. PtaU1.Bin125]